MTEVLGGPLAVGLVALVEIVELAVAATDVLVDKLIVVFGPVVLVDATVTFDVLFEEA